MRGWLVARLLLLAMALIGCKVAPFPPSAGPVNQSTAASSSAPPARAPAQPTIVPSPSGGSEPVSAEASPTFQPNALAFADPALGFLGGGVARADGTVVGVVLRSSDGGRHWGPILETPTRVAQLWVADSQVWARTACDEPDTACRPELLRSPTADIEWSETSASPASVSFLDALHGWAVGDSPDGPRGAPLERTTDGGLTWAATPSPCEGSTVGGLRVVAFRTVSSGLALCANTLGAGGEFRNVLRTTDGGLTWHVVASVAPPGGAFVGAMPYGGYVRGLVVTSDGTAWLWGDRMVPLSSNDHGAIWRSLGIGDADALPVTAAWPLDADHGFVLVWDPERQATLVEATDDGGATWSERASFPVAAIPQVSILPSLQDPLVPAYTVDQPAVVVSPSTGLQDGQTLQVRVTGFGVGGKVFLSECASAEVASALGCGAELAAQPFLVSDDDRAGSAVFVVRSHAPVRSLTVGQLRDCAERCVIVATLGGGYPYALAPISFGAP